MKGRQFKRVFLSLIILTLVKTNVFAIEPEAIPGEYVVELKSNALFNQDFEILEKTLGGKILNRIPEASVLLVKRESTEDSQQALQNLNESTIVEIAEPNYIYHGSLIPNDLKLKELWGLINFGQKDSKNKFGIAGIDIGMTKAWELTSGSPKIVVGVIDSGVNYNHPDLRANVWTNKYELFGKKNVDDDKNGYVDDIYGYNFADNKGDPMDDNGHGSHVSGTIGASGNDGNGLVGVNWKIQIMALKFLSSNGNGSLFSAVEAIGYGTKMGAKILSNSWGGGAESKLLQKMIEKANAKNVLFVAAAGNDTNDNDLNPSFPANYNVSNVVSVAAIDNQGSLASFSNYGRKTVHVAAPGVNIVSCTVDGYASWSGTSMATPHVSGIAALMLSQNNKLLPNEIRRRLIATSRILPGLKGKVVSNGLVNAYYALLNKNPNTLNIEPLIMDETDETSKDLQKDPVSILFNRENLMGAKKVSSVGYFNLKLKEKPLCFSKRSLSKTHTVRTEGVAPTLTK